MTTKAGRLEVVDAASSAPLFVIEGVKPGSGLGFANGIVVFEVPDGVSLNDRPMEARVGTTHVGPYGMVMGTSRETETEESGSEPHYASATQSLLRGSLEFYRTIETPSPGGVWKFLVRTDLAGTAKERTVLCIMGDPDVHIYDLEQGALLTVVYTASIACLSDSEQYLEGLAGVEVDDEITIVCVWNKIRIISRETRQLVLTFPKYFDRAGNISVQQETAYDLGRQIVDIADDHAQKRGKGKDQEISAVADTSLCLPLVFTVPLRRHIDGCNAERNHLTFGINADRTKTWRLFRRCRHVGDDLVYGGVDCGGLYVTRHYRSILRIEDAVERSKARVNHTLRLREAKESCDPLRVLAMATDRSRIMIVSFASWISSFDLSALPDICYDNNGNHCALPAHVATVRPAETPADLSVRRMAMDAARGPIIHAIDMRGKIAYRSRCLQVDRDNIYLAYAVDVPPPMWRENPRDERLGDYEEADYIIQAWNFAAEP